MSLSAKTDYAKQLIAEVIGGLASTGGGACVTSSFQADCMVLLHLVIQEVPEIPVLFLDTGYHFPETYAYRDGMTARYALNTVNLVPKLSAAEQDAQFGILNQTAPERCCGMRKVDPLFAGLSGYEAWFTALRREQSPSRAKLAARADFQLPGGQHILKVSPLADWSIAEVWAYLELNDVPKLPLYERGYTSIGCAPCTSPPLDPSNLRSGRWAGQKLECGIHIPAS
ncbi:MAG: phosphoadenylyl-sulfate reductase [Acidobacteriota bacterium]|nr:phosphoadenylyl-sulfate reductase [Acidobacteriota bacterium]